MTPIFNLDNVLSYSIRATHFKSVTMTHHLSELHTPAHATLHSDTMSTMPNDSTLLMTFEPRNLGGCAEVVSTSITFKLQADIRDHVHKRDTNSSAPKWYAHS